MNRRVNCKLARPWAGMAAAALALVSIHVSVAAAGSDDQASSADDIARKLADPAAPIVSVPLQCNYLAEAGPDGRYDNQQLKLQPVIPFVGDRGKYLLVDGHLRIEALRADISESAPHGHHHSP